MSASMRLVSKHWMAAHDALVKFIGLKRCVLPPLQLRLTLNPHKRVGTLTSLSYDSLEHS